MGSFEQALSPKKSEVPENRDNSIEQNELVDAALEALVSNSRYLDSGNNGVIRTMILKDAPDNIKKIFKEETGEDSESEYAIKLLKIYSEGLGEKEFLMQKKAYELISSLGDGKNFAKIPKPILYRKLEIKQEAVREMLKNDGISAPKKVEILVMDMIEGEDLAKNLYKTIIRHGNNQEESSLEHMPIEDLQAMVSHILDFHAPKNRIDAEAMNRVFRDNAKKIIPFLRKKGIDKPVLDPDIIEKLKNTINLLHNNGIYHRDLHERNVMLRDNDGERDVFIIDFGSAVIAEKNSGNDIYEDGDKKLVNDEMIIHTYRELTLSRDENQKEEIASFNNELSRLRNRLSKKPEWQKLMTDLHDPAMDNLDAIDRTIELFVMKFTAAGSSLYWDLKALALQELAKDNTAMFEAMINKLKTAKLTPYASNLLNKLIKTI